MRQNKTELELALNQSLDSSLDPSTVSASSPASSYTMAYNEMADVTVQMIDPVEQVGKNLAHLQELQSRMKFMMREIRYLMKI